MPRIVALVSARAIACARALTCLLTHVFTPAHAGIHTSPSINTSRFFKDGALLFLISRGEQLSQPTMHANKIIISIFLIVKATILDTHTVGQ